DATYFPKQATREMARERVLKEPDVRDCGTLLGLRLRRELALLGFAVAFSVAPSAHARRMGIQAAGCWACHGTTYQSTVTLAPDHEPILPGETVKFMATVSWEHIAVGGIFVLAPELGELFTESGQGLTLSDGHLTHSSPKAAVDGKVTFEFWWKAPEQPGALLLGAYALAANNDRRNSGDAAGQGYVNLVFGCEPKDFFYDGDKDGHGTPDPTIADKYVSCADQPAPQGYAPLGDDCDDRHEKVFPGAPERCNDEDDNCNGEVDENTSPEPLWPDPDGDGFYTAGATDTIIGCLPLEGYAVEPGDCAPDDATRFPGAEEVCNGFDDDCDFNVDEYVRPRCGVGRCERESVTCEPEDCRAADPISEICNGLDDDCDGEVDDEEPCGDDRVCLGIKCVAVEGAGGAPEPDGTGGSSAESSSGASGGTTAARSGSGASSSENPGGAASEVPTGGGDSEPGEPGPSGSEGQPSDPVAVTPALKSGCGLARGERSLASAFGAAFLFLLLQRRRGARSYARSA
ncbi:MAG TPA: putative metal-binding motif-containing protein, partial [Polyangiaceae bacterium]